MKVIQTGTTRKLGCGFLFAFHNNYGRIFNRLWDIHRQTIAWPWKLVLGLLKVTGAARYTIYVVLLVRYCKYSSILYRFWVIWRWIISWPWNLGYWSRKIIQNCTIRKLWCGFLFAFHCNYGSILHQFRDKAIYWSIIVIFSYPLAFDAPVREVPVEIFPFRLVWKN